MNLNYCIVRKNFLFYFLLLISFNTSAQTPKQFLQQALAAYGPWEKVQSLYYATDRINVNPWQSYSFTNSQPARHQWETYIDFTNGSYRNHSIFNYPGGYVFDLVNIGKDSTRWFFDGNKARNGKVLVKQGKDGYTANRNTNFQSLVYYTVKNLADAADSVEYKAQGKDIVINRFTKTGTISYLFDAQSKLLKKTERVAGGKRVEMFFENYKIYYDLQVATTMRQLVDGEMVNTELFRKFQLNPKVSPDIFIVPAEYQLQQQQVQQPLQAKSIAKDVFLIEGVGGDRNIVFVNMNDYIVVTEAPLSSDVTKGVLDIIHKTIPGKQVKYVHISHHHNDHTSGIRQVVAEGATIISTPPVEAPMRAILNGALGTPADDYSKNPKPPVFEFINGIKVLEDKDHRIEFHSVKNSHAEGLSFMYLPKEKIIYEGDLLTIPEDGTITPAVTVTKEFDEYLKKNKIIYRRMIGHHSHSFITPQMFDQMLTAK